jgi:hypothetical protein
MGTYQTKIVARLWLVFQKQLPLIHTFFGEKGGLGWGCVGWRMSNHFGQVLRQTKQLFKVNSQLGAFLISKANYPSKNTTQNTNTKSRTCYPRCIWSTPFLHDEQIELFLPPSIWATSCMDGQGTLGSSLSMLSRNRLCRWLSVRRNSTWVTVE